MRDLIFVSLEDWDEIWRRNQFVCAHLAKRHPQARILFVGVPRNAWRYLRRGELGPLFRSACATLPQTPNIILLSPWQLLPNRFRWSRRINQWLVRAHVRRTARRLRFARPVLWLNPPDALHMIGKMGEAAVIYDITDDWTLLDQPADRRRLLKQQDAELCRRAAGVIVCSEQLLSSRRALTAKIHLIPNGVDAAHYASVCHGHDGLSAPALPSRPKPVLAYTGTLHGERLDVELVRQMAGAPGIGSVVLIGPNHLSEDELERLRLPNIFVTGPVPYAELPQHMQAVDAFIVPHRVTAFTESLNPIKLWEYLAAGKPVIATPVAGFRDFPQFVYLAENVESFAGALQKGLRENTALPAKRQAEARKHSWDARVDAIEEVLASCEPS